MNARRLVTKLLLALVALLALQPGALLACSVCYGEVDSPTTRGLVWAIGALGLTILCVLGGVVAFFVHTNRRSMNLPGGNPPANS